ncbi:PREDICTED: uncharacterized protein LOC105452927 [Wasmannia auropunctata]|uniref:uncharacterized protein LOC105452927 n=1 Tax=Wasmannia auropunctata TaxID=64793 RepID=UPI0005EEEE2C|nr:PREDICTED: uncharacterized protein LOC105452927 [Wasmannia auropunctata]
MKTLAFVVCILATITIGDAALISNLVNTLVTSSIFNIKVLIDFQRMYTQCALELGLLKSLTPEISFCVAEKKNLVDEEGALKWDMTYDYMAKLIRDKNKIDFLNAYFKKCKIISK